MNPAFSVILFTTLSGLGYGMLAWLGVWIAICPPMNYARGTLASSELLFGQFIALLLVGAALTAIGLLSSLFHLGKPQRAWRAFSQWRSSWLSREGVMAMGTYVAAAALIGLLLALLHVGTTAALPGDWLIPVAGIALALFSLVTVFCTAMIYVSLKPVPAWRHGLVAPVYLVFAMFQGLLLLACAARTHPPMVLLGVALLALALAAIKLAYWRDIDHIALPSRESATALEGIGKVATFERPHTEENYLTREMGFVLARKHSRKLRLIALLLFAGIPLLAVLASTLLPSTAAVALWIAAVSALIGTFVERWLFFAEARHMVMLYY